MNIVITGAGKGIGFALVNRFLEQRGHKVWACSRDVSNLKKIENPDLASDAVDISLAASEEIYKLVSVQFDTVDVLIHNAGMLINEPFESTSLDSWKHVFEVNLFSVIKINLALLPLLRKAMVLTSFTLAVWEAFRARPSFRGYRHIAQVKQLWQT